MYPWGWRVCERKNMRNSVVVSAPGKLLLMGEHAVVYGRPCLVVAVNKRIKLTLEKTVNNEWVESPFVNQAIQVFRDEFHLSLPVKIIATSEFPRSLGLGSSSAVTVGIIYGLAKLFLEKDLDNKKLFELSFRSVKNVQGVGSGFDVAAAIYGGVIYYKNRGEIINPITYEQLPIVVGYTGTKADTVSMVEKVAEKRKEDPIAVDTLFNNIADLVERAKIALFEQDWETLGSLMNLDQEYLSDLGVSTDRLDQMVRAAIKAGAYGAKLSGAGGGDCMIAVVNKEKQRLVQEAIQKTGGQILELAIEPEGVKEE